MPEKMALEHVVLRVGAMVACLLSLVLAQTPVPSCPTGQDLNVSTSAGFERLNDCSAWNGNVRLVWTDAGDLATYLHFGSLERVTGSVLFTDQRSPSKDATATEITIEADELDSIVGQLLFEGIHRLNMPSFSSLKSVHEIRFDNVNFTGNLSFGSEKFDVLTQVASMAFTNTNIAAIGAGWSDDFSIPTELAVNTTFTFQAEANSDLRAITVPGFRSNVADIHIEGNSPDLAVVFPDLTNCTINLQGVKSFTADSLLQIGSDDAIPLNGIAATTNAVPGGKATKRQQDGSSDTNTNTISNNNFEELRLPALSTIIGPFQLSDNPALNTISFPELLNVFGTVEMSGEAIHSVVLGSSISFPEDGELVIDSSNPQLCDTAPLNQPGIRCQPISQPTDSPQAGNGDGDASGSDNGNSSGGGLSTAAKAGIGVGIGLGIPLILILAFFLYRRRSRKARSPGRTARSMGADLPYSKDATSPSEAATSPARYSKVPSELRTEEVRRPVSGLSFDHDRVSGEHGYSRSGSRGLDQPVHAIEMEEQQGERFEMEEQQGMRHEMDARSLPDIDLDDESFERRSLEDIERSRNSGPPAGAGAPLQQGPVSPVG